MSAHRDRLEQRLREYVDEVWQNGNLDAIEEYVRPDYVEHHLFSPYQRLEGIEEHRANVEEFVTAFPDMEFDIERVVVDGNKTAQLFTCRGTNQGEFMGAPPTGESVQFSAIGITEWENGQMVEDWSQVDVLTIMEQLGMAPEAEE